jgi:hypothetical protein
VVRPVKKLGSAEAQKLGSSEGRKTVKTETVKPGVKVVKVEMEEGVYARLRSELGLKMAMGNFYGLQDEFLKIIISTIDKGDDFVHVTLKGDKK